MLHQLTIPYSNELLLSMNIEAAQFEAEARLLLAVKLYEQGRLSTGLAAQVAGMGRVQFIFQLSRFGLSPINVNSDELTSDIANA